MKGCTWDCFLNKFSETKTVTFMQKVIYLRYLLTTKWLLIADGQKKIQFCQQFAMENFMLENYQ